MSKRSPAATEVTQDQVRAFWVTRAGLGRPVAKRPDAVVAKCDWPRTLGGVSAYLALRARCPDSTRAAVDRAVAKGKVRVAPALRGCIYLVPERHHALLMRLADVLARPRLERDLDKAGATMKEVDDAAEAIASVLADGPKSTDAIRAALPSKTVRSLGARGKRVGMSSVLPAALRELEFRGRVRRTLEGGRIDSERYLWALESGEPPQVPAGGAELIAEVLDAVLAFVAPATTKQLADFIGVPQRDVKAGLEAIGAVPVAVAGWSSPGFVRGGDARALTDASVEPQLRLIAAFDNLVTVHDGVAPLVDPAHHGERVTTWGGRGKPATLGDAKHLGHHCVLLGDRVIGLWEYDPDSARVVVGTFGAAPRGKKGALTEAASEVAAFINDELERAHLHSLDSDDNLRARLARVRALDYHLP